MLPLQLVCVFLSLLTRRLMAFAEITYLERSTGQLTYEHNVVTTSPTI